MFRRNFYIDFFYKHILDIDMVNKAIVELIAANGGNKKIIAGKLGITPQFLGQLERGERKKPSAELVQRIKQVYGVDIMNSETIVSRETEIIPIRSDLWDQLKQNNLSFMESQKSFQQTLEHLKKDKDQLYAIINRLLGERSQAAQKG